MFELLSPLSKYFKFKRVWIYDGIFILHSKITVSILIACTIIISAKQYFGEPIRCITDSKYLDFINNFCWTIGTYIIQYSNNDLNARFHYSNSKINQNQNHHNNYINELIDIGIGPETKTSKRIYLRYYQWVVLILLLQAFSFSIPSFLWKFWEGGRLQELCGELGSALIPDEWSKKRKELLVTYFSTDYKDIHMYYALKYAFCEILNFTICIINIFLMNVFFSGFWTNYAPVLSVISSYEWDTWNRMTTKVFPKMAKCAFKSYGYSGSDQNLDVLCLLPLNILNEKLFAFLWIWFISLFFISLFNCIYRIMLLLNSKFRLHLLQTQIRTMESEQFYKIFSDMNFGDWFILYRVSSNVNPIIFSDLLQELSLSYNKKRDDDDKYSTRGIIV